MSRLRRAQVVLLAIACAAVQNACSAKAPAAVPDIGVEVFESSADLRESLQQKASVAFGAPQSSPLTINVDDAVTYQQMDGFGASITESSAWLMYNKLSVAQRDELMEKLFDPVKGIGLSFLRQPMGASDFALKDYSYNDLPAGQRDPALTQFSIAHDRAYIVPLLRQAIALNPQIKIMASPWSPPGWMKTSDSMIEGKLLATSYPALAKYFVKFVHAYAAEGIPIYAVSMQNEPLFSPGNYPGTLVTAEEQAVFIRDHLGPAFRAQNLDTKIMVFDHNWDLISYANTVLSDPKAASFVAGTAVHCYGGSVTAQTQLRNQFPDKDIWETECSGGAWQPKNLLSEQVGLIIGSTRNWAKGVILWNLALDQTNGPHLGGCGNCRGLVTIDTNASPSTTTLTVDYVALGHASKFVSPGAWRVESNSFDTGLQDVAFRNPDGSIVLLALNSGSTTVSFHVGWSGRSFAYTLNPGSAATFRWRPPGQRE